ncbi:hypothetical protein HPB49_013252 [Dermacentor silvarum]|uniref:Uncharacterized protein n=1 Tax=Dermacentor silvarum TaxID=543639 RepID=A0ACB8C3T5_DERSI|nr:E2F-associated phosphoprotein [Dermacentor silvarum]KAH7933503.1 hypothetical protein HPB49_013252 [Dermacentor silvarum]
MDYDYQVCEDSDSEGYDSSSSEDAFEAYVRQKYLSQPDQVDDFDKEMENELSATFKVFEQRQLFDAASTDSRISAGPAGQRLAVKGQQAHTTEKPGQSGGGLQDANTESRKAEDSAQMTAADGSSPKVKEEDDKKTEKSGPSNDDLFYDPEMDDEDEKWVNEQRRSCIFPDKSEHKDGGKAKPLPQSDAVLNCPGCMTLLCLDCQRHEIYNTQYRAMFVKNCVVNRKETLRCLPSRSSSKRRQNLPEGVNDPRDIFNPVQCEVCRTEVAVYDSEEVYHFFNVIASFS